MFSVEPKAGVRFLLNDEIYTIHKRLPGLKIEAVSDRFGETKRFTFNELIKYLNNGELRFEYLGRNPKQSSDPPLFKTSFSTENLEDSPYKEQAIFRYEVIYPILKTQPNQRHQAIKNRVEEVNSWADNPIKAKENLNGSSYYQIVSYTSIWRWVKFYVESNGDISSLFPLFHKNGGKGKSRLEPQIIDFIQERINEAYKNKQRISREELWFQIINEIDEFNKFSPHKLRIPSYPTIVRIVNKIPEYELVATRIGKKTADNKFNQVGNGVKVTRPMERVEADQSDIDLMIIDDYGTCQGRPFLILAIDKFSGLPVGLNFGISNGVGWAEVMPCIKDIMTDKSYIKEIYPFIENDWTAFGVPETIVIDNGPNFKNQSMTNSCYQLGIVLRHARVGVPWWKGAIERFFRTYCTSLIHNIPGTTRSNPKELGDDENPAKLACVTFSTFVTVVYKWIIDVYSQSLNKGVGGIPARIWEKAIEEYPVRWPGDISETARLLGRTEYRQISREGIAVNCLYYNNDEINELLKQFNNENNGLNEDFLVKYDPRNLGEISVYDHLINKKWINGVPCTDPEYATNLSEWEHKQIRARARKEYGDVDYISLARAKACIRKMIEDGIGYTKKEIARAKGINSSQVNSDKLSAKETSSINDSDIQILKPESTELAISDRGLTLTVKDTIVPESAQILGNQQDDGKVININTGINKKKNKSSNKNLIEQTTSSPDNFSINNLKDFSIISNFVEVTFNE